MIQQFKYLLATIVMLAICSWWGHKWWVQMQIWQHGTVQEVFVAEVHVPTGMHSRGRHPDVYVQSGDRVYRIYFYKKQPSGERLKEGDTLRVRIHPDYQEAQRENRNPLYDLMALIPFIVLTGWIVTGLFRNTAQPWPRKPKKKRKSLKRKHTYLVQKNAMQQRRIT